MDLDLAAKWICLSPPLKALLQILLVVAVDIVVALAVRPAVLWAVNNLAVRAVGAGTVASAVGIVGGVVVGAMTKIGYNIVDGVPIRRGLARAAINGAAGA